MARTPRKDSAGAADPSAKAAAGSALAAASPGDAGPATSPQPDSAPVAVMSEPDSAPEPKPVSVIDEMSDFLDMLGADVLRGVHGLQANAETLSRRLAQAGHIASHAVMADVANVVGEFRNGLSRIMASKH